jgi:hypothetical protein
MNIGWNTAPGASKKCYIDDFYIDDGATLDDPGDIRVTNKLPSAENTNTFDNAIGNARGTTDYNNVNERPINEGNGWKHLGSGSASENYGIQGIDVGDVTNLSSQTLVARMSWVWAKKGSGTGAGEAIFNNSATPVSIALTTTSALYTNVATSATYPSDAAAVGLRSTGGGADTFLYECGMLIAYRVSSSGVTLSGTVYTSTGAAWTPSSGTMAISVNGGTKTTGAVSSSTGTFSVSATANANDKVLAWVDTATAADRGVLYPVKDAGALTGLSVTIGRVQLQDNRASPAAITNQDVDDARGTTGFDNVLYTDGGGTALTLTGTGTVLYANGAYSPGGAVTAPSLTAASGTVTLGTSATTQVDGTVTVSGGTLTLGSGAILSLGTASAAGTVSVTGGTFRMTGTNAEVKKAAAASAYGFTVSSGGTIDLQDGIVRDTNASGLDINGGSVTNLKNVEFRNVASGASRFLRVTTNSVDLDCPGVYFDTLSSGQVNVAATGTATRLRFEDRLAVKQYGSNLSTTVGPVVTATGGAFGTLGVTTSDLLRIKTGSDKGQYAITAVAENQLTLLSSLTGTASSLIYDVGTASTVTGPGAGEVMDSDHDTNDNGVIDGGETSNGSIVQWLYSANTSNVTSTGTFQGFPANAFDTTTWAYYSTYAVVRDYTGGDDRIYVRHLSGDA